MQLDFERHGAVTIVRPDGPLTEVDAKSFLSEMRRLAEESMGRVALDAGKIAFVDSAGLEVLLEMTEWQGRSGQSLKLCCVNETLREVLELTELAPMFEHYEDPGSAARSFL